MTNESCLPPLPIFTTQPPCEQAKPLALSIPRHATPSPELQALAYTPEDLEASDARANAPTIIPPSLSC